MNDNHDAAAAVHRSAYAVPERPRTGHLLADSITAALGRAGTPLDVARLGLDVLIITDHSETARHLLNTYMAAYGGPSDRVSSRLARHQIRTKNGGRVTITSARSPNTHRGMRAHVVISTIGDITLSPVYQPLLALASAYYQIAPEIGDPS